MPLKPVLLWTDALIYLLIAVLIAFAWYVRRNEHLRAPWRRVARSASGMSALTVLIFFVVIGILDSLHYRPALPAAKGEPVIDGRRGLHDADAGMIRVALRRGAEQ